MGISRQAYYKRNRAEAARLVWIRKLPISFNKSACGSRGWAPESCITCCNASLNLSCKWGEIGCFRFCVNGVYWWLASGLITRRPIVIIAFTATRTCSNQVLIRLFPAARNKSGWLT